MATLKEIQDRFSYQFAGRNIGFSIANGWLPEFETLCTQIDQLLGDDKMGFHWVQLKEKFGSARYYWEMDEYQPGIRIDFMSTKGVISMSSPPEISMDSIKVLAEKIDKMINMATAKTQDHCICCGAPGKLDRHGGYHLILCEDHSDIRKKNGDLDIWPLESDDEQ